MNKGSRIYISGHTGMLGRAVQALLELEGYGNLLVATSRELDLREQVAVQAFFEKHRPEVVVFCAAKVGGIQANIDSPAVFLHDNLVMQSNVIHQAFLSGVKKLVFVGSSCVYPRECPQPMREEFLLSGGLEPTNEGYAVAKIAGLKMCEFYYKQYGFRSIAVMPCNLYGEHDLFDARRSHVLSALVKKMCDARKAGLDSIELWGTGVARREFMHADDCARAVLFMLLEYSDYGNPINIGWGEDVSILELAGMVRRIAGFEGSLEWDPSRPDGMLRKCLDVGRMRAMGFEPRVALEEGVCRVVGSYVKRLSAEAI